MNKDLEEAVKLLESVTDLDRACVTLTIPVLCQQAAGHLCSVIELLAAISEAAVKANK